jgi:hypothetical protein
VFHRLPENVPEAAFPEFSQPVLRDQPHQEVPTGTL